MKTKLTFTFRSEKKIVEVKGWDFATCQIKARQLLKTDDVSFIKMELKRTKS